MTDQSETHPGAIKEYDLAGDADEVQHAINVLLENDLKLYVAERAEEALARLVAQLHALISRSETHPGAVDTTQYENGWRAGVADAWRAIELEQTAPACRVKIAMLGNKGPGK